MQIYATFPIKWVRILDYYLSQNDFIKHVKVHADLCYLSYQMSPDSRLLLIPKWFYKTCESACRFLLPFLSNETGFSIITDPKMIL